MSYLTQEEFDNQANALEEQAEQLARKLVSLTNRLPQIPSEFIEHEDLAFVLEQQRFRGLYSDVQHALGNNGGNLKAATLKVSRVQSFLNNLTEAVARLIERVEEVERHQYNGTVDSEANDLDRYLRERFPNG